ncbi:MAG TPA: cell envelope integrity protein TolA [Candidatus Paceibacterota bacterium]
MRGLLRISLIFVALLLVGAQDVHAFSGIPAIDAQVTQQQLQAIGTTCSSAQGAQKTRGAFGERGTGTKDSCIAEDDDHRIFCRYSSASGQYRDAEYCQITYKDIQPPAENTKTVDVNLLNVTGGGVDQDVTTQQEADSSGQVASAPKSCSAFDIAACIRALPGMLFVALGFIFLTISGLILFLAGTLFNWVVLRTVFQFGEYFGTSEGMLVAWGVVRDIANIGLLFGFILMGVLLILNVDGGGHGHGHGGGISAKKAIPRLIIFAVLLNFSLFTTQFVVDIANAFGSTFTTLAGDTECEAGVSGGTGGSESLEDCAVKTGISGKILAATGITKINDLDAAKEGIEMFFNRTYQYATSLMMLSVFVLITAMVLLAGAVMLVIRVVVLSFLMVTSPIGFAGMVIPGLSGIAQKWWDTLIHQAFFAPVYLLLIFISIKLTEGLIGNGNNLTNAIIGNQGVGTAGNVQVVMIYAIVIGFMIASLVAAQKMGAMGAKFATSSAAALTVGSAGFVGRRTLGVGSEMAAKRIAQSSWARNNGFGSRTAYNLFNKGATSSFSLRNGLGGAAKGMGLDMGKASKDVSHGIHGIVEKEVKARKEFADKGIKQTGAEVAQENALKDEKEQLKYYKSAAQEQAARDKDTDEAPIKAQENAYKAMADARTEAIESKKRGIASLIKAGGGGDALKREEEALEALEEAHAQASATEAADIAARKQLLDERQARYQQTIKGYDDRSKQIDREISGYEEFDPATRKMVWRPGVSQDSARRTYGEAIKAQHGLPWPSVGHHVNEEAAADIIKKLKKSKRDKLIDALKENAKDEEKEEKKDDHGGGDDHGKGGDKGGGGHAPH